MKVIKEDKQAGIFQNNKLIAVGLRGSNNLYSMLFSTALQVESNVTTCSNLQIWHERLAHINKKSLLKMISAGFIEGVSSNEIGDFFCEACALGKQHKFPFSSSERMKTKPGERIYSNLCGPISESSLGGANYFIQFKDDCSGYQVISFIKHKSDAIDSFKTFCRTIKNKCSYSVKTLHKQ